MKRIMSEKKNCIDLFQEPRLEKKKNKSENEKINDLLTNTSAKNITELNYLIDAGAKLLKKKVEFP